MKTRTVVALFALMVFSGGVQAFTLVSENAKARIVVGAEEPESVFLAAVDLTNDVKQISGVNLDLRRATSAARGDVFIQTVRDGRWEAYSVKEADGMLRVVGSDARGTMFGVYDFIERYLKVDPMWFWSDIPYPSSKTLAWEKVEIEQNSPTFRFRGWFLNDEDLLTKWRRASGVRDYSTYPYYHHVVNHGAMARVAEALVRSRMNMIIPASFLNVSRPAEERLAAICARRGVFVSMHHIEPMGVSGYTFKDYWRRRGRGLNYSYFKHPQEVEETWREMATRWKKFPNVVWQIGLRGTGDRPAWVDDPTMPKDDAGRAKLISSALARQVAILDEIGVPKENRVVTTTLWAEGAYFYERGLLEIPQGTIVVLADNNCGWRWHKDMLEGPRVAGLDYGLYYHHQLITMGPHLVSLVPARKTYEMLVTAREKKADAYAIFNVGNVREFVYGIDATAKMTWNLDRFNADEWTKAWLQRRVPSAANGWHAMLNIYHRALQLYPPTGTPRFLDGQLQSLFNNTLNRLNELAAGKLPCRPKAEPAEIVYGRSQAKDPFGKAVSDCHPPLGALSDIYVRLMAQRAGYEQALLFAQRAMSETKVPERRFAEDFLVYPAQVMLNLTEANARAIVAEENLRAGDRTGAVKELEAAAAALERVVASGKDYCRGQKWEAWYRGCQKVSPQAMLKRTEAALKKLRAK